jgi:hypothetical protein
LIRSNCGGFAALHAGRGAKAPRMTESTVPQNS